MSRTKKIVIAAVLVLIVGAPIGANLWLKRRVVPAVTVEAIRLRDLEAIVSASGKIQPKRSVNMSANVMGKVTRLSVQEGDRVKTGQFLLQIDPTNAVTAVQRGEAQVEAARSTLQQAREALLSATANLELARQTLTRQQDLWKQGLTTKEQLDRAVSEVQVRESDLKARRQEIATREMQIKQESASLASSRYNLSLVTLTAPMDGLVTRRNIEEGENVLVGTMNNAGTVLLTIADMSVIEAEVEVDETDIPSVLLGQRAKVTIDAVPNREFHGRVTEIGNSPILTAAQQQSSTGRQATNFKVVVTIEEPVPDIRPGFTCTADITTATRKQAVAVPIQALTIRELVYDQAARIVRQPPPDRPKRGFFSFGASSPSDAAPVPPPELQAGQTRKETEGVFAFRADGKVEFSPVKVGIAGERYFEVLSGLKAGDRVITGPFSVVREIADGDTVKEDKPKK